MNDTFVMTIGILLPLLGSALGASAVFLMRGEMGPAIQKLLLGFASGVMIAASVWSLLIPAIDMAAGQGRIAWVPAAIGFLLGIGFLLVLDTVIPHLHLSSDEPEGPKSSASRPAMLIFAVTLHNIPEGMAVGVLFAAAANDEIALSAASALALAIGIAIQNVPEGAVISMPLVGQGYSRRRAFSMGMLSGVVEPIGAFLALWLTGLMVPLLPYVLSFAAGAMIYVVVEELIPESQAGAHSNVGTIGAALGFVLMMILDVALG